MIYLGEFQNSFVLFNNYRVCTDSSVDVPINRFEEHRLLD